jgi:Asp-tRNA(Asn)/Glu-tRNA(Gln) amidotransferase A subunit family amidase
MSMADTLAFQSIGSLAARIRQGGVSPVALTEALLARIDALDPHLYAKPFDEAMALRDAWAYEQATEWRGRRPT